MNKQIETKQVVACYMLSVDKFSMSINSLYKYAKNLRNILNNCEKHYVLAFNLEELTQSKDSMFEESEDMLYLKKEYGRKELNEMISSLPYEVISSINKDKEINFSFCDDCEYSV